MKFDQLSSGCIGNIMLALLAALLAPDGARAQQGPVTCGEFYRVKPGDTLRGITLRAYRHDRYAVVFRANQDVLANPAQIEIGQLLFLPCEGTGPQHRTEALSVAGVVPSVEDQSGTRAAARAASTSTQNKETERVDRLPKPTERGVAQTRVVKPVPSSGGARTALLTPQVLRPSEPARTGKARPDQPVLLLSASGLEPLAGDGLEAGGVVGALIEAALKTQERNVAVEPVFVNDRKAHLDVLLPLDAFGLGYPWPAPDCGETKGKRSRDFCDAFAVSLPIFQVEMRMMVREGDPAGSATNLPQVKQSKICRPEAFPPFDLEQRGFTRVAVAQDYQQCLRLLSEGVVDLVSVPEMMIEAGTADAVENETLRYQEPVHAIFSRSDPHTQELLEALDAGLSQLQSSGEWFSIVSRYLRRYHVSSGSNNG